MKNKFLLVFVLFLLSSFTRINISPNLSGIIKYNIIKYENDDKSKKINSLTIEQKQKYSRMISQLEEEMQKINYFLKFNNSRSIFLNEVGLSYEDPMKEMARKMALSLTGGDGVFYKDFSKNIKILQKEYGHQTIDIITTDEREWTITDERKIIGDYVCMKATTNETVLNRNGKELKKRVIAWYTPEIPVAVGPMGYGGLPGVILELHSDQKQSYYIRASEITIGESIVSSKDLKMYKADTEMSHKEWMEFMREENKRHRAR